MSIQAKIYIPPIICGVILALFAFKESALLQLASMVALLVFIGLFFYAIAYIAQNWKQKRWASLLPLLITILCFQGPRLGFFLRDAYFRTQIPYLEKAIQAYETTGSFPDVKWHGYMAHAFTYKGDVYAIFGWGGGFPVKHRVLLYSSAADIKDYCKANGWSSGYQLQEKWWIVRD